MEKLTLKEGLKVFGFKVTIFPEGIGAVLEQLVNRIPEGLARSYYGISEMTKDGMIYRATVEEKEEEEGAKYSCESYSIEKGEYLTITLTDWRQKTDSIKDIFHVLLQDNRVDKKKPAIEWYKNEHEMLCMLKIIDSVA